MRQITRFLAVSSLLAIAAVSLPAPAVAAPLEKPNLTVAVGGKTFFYYLPLSIAQYKGFFKQEGLNVTIADFPGGAKALQALVGGSVDAVSGAYEHTIQMQAKGIPIEAIALQTSTQGIALGVNKNKAAHFHSYADLKGMKIGVTAPGSSTDGFVGMLLKRGHVNRSDVSIIGVGAGQQAVAAMQSGEIDAISNLDPVINALENTAGMKVVADTRSAKGTKQFYGGPYAAGCIYVKPEFVRQNPRTAQAIANVIYRSVRWLQHASPDAIVNTLPASYYVGGKAQYRAALLKNLDAFKNDAAIHPDVAQRVYRAVAATDPAVASHKINLSATYDDRFVQNAARKYK